MRSYRGTVALGAALAIASTYAWLVAQPSWVWGPLILTGLLLAGLMLWATVKIDGDYREAELRRTIANDL